MSIGTFNLMREIESIKESVPPEKLGMILVHNGVVRATSRDSDSENVSGMMLSYDEEALERVMREARKREGIVHVSAWINKGKLVVGDDIMYVVVAGDRRSNVLPVFEELVEVLKREVVREVELQ